MKTKKTKSASQQLRNVFFILWKERGQEGEFDTFYLTQMQKVIAWVKTLINKTQEK